MELALITQLIGMGGLFLGIAAYLSKDDRLLKFLISISACALSLHFFLLGAYVATGAAAFTGIRSFMSIFKSVKSYAPLFFIAYIPLGYFCIMDWLDVLPIMAGLMGTYAMFYLEKLPLRYGLLVTTSLWFVHNLLQGSIGGTLLEMFYIIANLRTIYKIRKEEVEDIDPPISQQ